MRGISGVAESHGSVWHPHECHAASGSRGASGSARRAQQVAKIRAHTPLPIAVGFGISNPEQVRAALAMGAAGAISGSAVVRLAAEGGDVEGFVREMKDATRTGGKTNGRKDGRTEG